LKFNYLYQKIPGNKFEKDALDTILKLQLISIFLSIIFFSCSFYFNKYFIYAISLLYPILETGTSSIPIVLQEPGKANRYNAPSYAFFSYLLLFIFTLIFIIATLLFNYKITIIGLIILYLISVLRIIKQFKKSTEFYNR